MNIIGYVLIVGVVAWRLFRVSLGNVGSTQIFFYVVLSIYLVAFAVALFLAEIKVIKVRLYLNFLDSKTGRGLFMILISALILENYAVEIILFCIILVFGSINVIIGCKQGSDSRENLELNALKNPNNKGAALFSNADLQKQHEKKVKEQQAADNREQRFQGPNFPAQ